MLSMLTLRGNRREIRQALAHLEEARRRVIQQHAYHGGSNRMPDNLWTHEAQSDSDKMQIRDADAETLQEWLKQRLASAGEGQDVYTIELKVDLASCSTEYCWRIERELEPFPPGYFLG